MDLHITLSHTIDKGFCTGDSGGPLMCEQNDEFVLHGVVSRTSVVACAKNYPDVYANVFNHMDLVNSAIDVS